MVYAIKNYLVEYSYTGPPGRYTELHDQCSYIAFQAGIQSYMTNLLVYAIKGYLVEYSYNALLAGIQSYLTSTATPPF